MRRLRRAASAGVAGVGGGCRVVDGGAGRVVGPLVWGGLVGVGGLGVGRGGGCTTSPVSSGKPVSALPCWRRSSVDSGRGMLYLLR